MRSHTLLPVLAIFASLAAAPSHAGSKTASTEKLDTAAVHRMYVDGDFAPAIAVLEKALRDKRVATHADSVFTFKHLGVMHAADYGSRETGKRYMYQLLYIEPTAKIMDMYASDMIYMIFKNVQAEVEINRVKLAKDTTGKDPMLPGQGGGNPPAKRTWPYWAGGAVVAAGIGVASYLIISEEAGAGKDHGID